MEASHKTHRPHIKVGKDEEEVRWFVFPGWVHIDIKEDGFMITHTCHCVYGGDKG